MRHEAWEVGDPCGRVEAQDRITCGKHAQHKARNYCGLQDRIACTEQRELSPVSAPARCRTAARFGGLVRRRNHLHSLLTGHELCSILPNSPSNEICEAQDIELLLPAEFGGHALRHNVALKSRDRDGKSREAGADGHAPDAAGSS